MANNWLDIIRKLTRWSDDFKILNLFYISESSEAIVDIFINIHLSFTTISTSQLQSCLLLKIDSVANNWLIPYLVATTRRGCNVKQIRLITRRVTCFLSFDSYSLDSKDNCCDSRYCFDCTSRFIVIFRVCRGFANLVIS